MEEEAKKYWATFEAWLKEWGVDTPKRYIDGQVVDRPYLEPAATEDDIRNVIEVTELPWPDELKAFYSLHNGSYSAFLPSGCWFSSCEDMIRYWQEFAELADEFNPDLEPLASSRCRNTSRCGLSSTMAVYYYKR